jgi:hypothetical protein
METCNARRRILVPALLALLAAAAGGSDGPLARHGFRAVTQLIRLLPPALGSETQPVPVATAGIRA